MKLLSLPTLLLLAGCAHGGSAAPFVSLVRADWVLAWERYEQSARVVDGRPLQTYGPAQGARQLVISRAEHEALVASGMHPEALGLLGMISPPRLTEVVGALRVGLGEVVTLEIEDEAVAELQLSGTAVRAHWTVPHRKVVSVGGRHEEHRSASLHLVGAAPGTATLRVRLATGEVRDLAVVVRSAAATGS